MARPSRKIRFLIDEEIGEELERLVPNGKRSRFVNEALRKELELARRKEAVKKLSAASQAQIKFTTKQILAKPARDRGRGLE